MLSTLCVVATTVVGLMVGVEFSVGAFMNPILSRLAAGPSIEAHADGGRLLGLVMPFWYFGSLILTVWLSVATWGKPADWTAVTAAALLAASVVVSLVVEVPINNRSKAWTADNHPADWREQHKRWDRVHYVRVAMIMAAFVLTAVSATLA